TNPADVARGQGGHGPVCKTGKDGFNSRSRIQLEDFPEKRTPVFRQKMRPLKKKSTIRFNMIGKRSGSSGSNGQALDFYSGLCVFESCLERQSPALSATTGGSSYLLAIAPRSKIKYPAQPRFPRVTINYNSVGRYETR